MEEKAMAKLVNFPSAHTIIPGGKRKAANHFKTSSTEETGIIKAGEIVQNKVIIAVSQETLHNLSASRMKKRNPAGLNNEGVIEIGPVQSFVFPPLNAPETVKIAWEKVTANLTDQETALAKAAFLELQLKANTYMTPEGEVKIVSSGEPEYRNIFVDNSSEAYLSLIDEAINILDTSSQYQDAKEKEGIQDGMAALEVFKANLLSMISNPSRLDCN
jgi:hypothetical protein